MNGASTIASESGVQNQSLPFYSAMYLSFILVRANKPLMFVLPLITSSRSLLQERCNNGPRDEVSELFAGSDNTSLRNSICCQ